jgi:hypothetical protein
MGRCASSYLTCKPRSSKPSSGDNWVRLNEICDKDVCEICFTNGSRCDRRYKYIWDEDLFEQFSHFNINKQIICPLFIRTYKIEREKLTSSPKSTPLAVLFLEYADGKGHFLSALSVSDNF